MSGSTDAISDGGRVGGGSTEAVFLARAVAAAFACAVEGSVRYCADVAGVAEEAEGAFGRAMGKAPRGRRADSVRGAEGSPSIGESPLYQDSAAPRVPKGFAAAVSLLVSVPCVQPELVRALRAVLWRFPYGPISALQQEELAGWAPSGRGELPMSVVKEQGPSRSGNDESGQGRGDMAPPPPREPSAKKRRVSIEGGRLRAAAAGRDGEGDRRESVLVSRNDDVAEYDPRERGREGGFHTGLQSSVSPLHVGPEMPPVFSNDSAVGEAVNVVLVQASAAIEALEARQMTVATLTVDRSRGDGEALGEDGDDSKGHLRLLLEHTASITCALRVLSCFVDAPQVMLRENDSTDRRLEFEGRGDNNRGSTTPGVARFPGRPRGSIGEEGHVDKESAERPNIFGQLLEGFAAATQAAALYEADGSHCGQGRRMADDLRPLVAAEAARSVAWLWDMLVNCVAELPVAFLISPPLSVANEESSSSAGDQGRAQGRLAAVVGFTAEKALEVILAPHSAVVGAAFKAIYTETRFFMSRTVPTDVVANAAAPHLRACQPVVLLWTAGLVKQRDGEGVGVGAPLTRATDTVLGPAATGAPLPMKCFLLAASFAKLCGKGDSDGAPKTENGPRSRSLHVNVKKEESLPKNKRARGDIRGSGNNHSSAGDEENSPEGKEPVFSAEKYFLIGFHSTSALVRQCAVAALPSLSLCENPDCVDGHQPPADEDIDLGSICNWSTQWLTALLELIGEKGGSSEAVRLELAASTLRLGASLDSSRVCSTRDSDKPPAPLLPGLHTKPSRFSESDPRKNHENSSSCKVVGPNVFGDLLALWPALLKDESALVRAAAARAVFSAAAAAPLSRLKAAGAPATSVLRLLVDMLACGDPEVAWVVAGGAGKLVADEAKLLRALYASGGEGEGDEEDDEDEEDTLGAEEENERERRLREKALSRFIETVGGMLREHGDRLRLGRWQSLHEFTALLRALG